MPNNNFITDTQKDNKPNFSRRFKFLLILAIFLTSISLIGLYSITDWTEFNDTATLQKALFMLCLCCVLVSLIRICADKSHLFRILTQGMQAVSIIFFAASFVFPRFSHYGPIHFQIFDNGIITLIDGYLFSIGILAVVLAGLIKEGVKMQTELDEIL